MMEFSFVLIPSDKSKGIETLTLDLSQDVEGNEKKDDVGGDQLAIYLQKQIEKSEEKDRHDQIQVLPLKRLTSDTATTKNLHGLGGCMQNQDDSAGIYAYFRHSNEEEADGNERATVLSMACGLHSQRFFGDIYISRLGYVNVADSYTGQHRQLRNLSFASEEIQLACLAGPDLRPCILRTLYSPATTATATATAEIINHVPNWLRNAAKCNYEDSRSLSTLASVMKQGGRRQHRLAQVHQHQDLQKDQLAVPQIDHPDADENDNSTIHIQSDKTASQQPAQNAVTRVPLCLHCRRPAYSLCDCCHGAYFCDAPRSCIIDCWSHRCVCKTWSLYTQRRRELSKFPFLQWHLPLMDRECQLSDIPYKEYLKNVLCVLPDDNSPITRADLWWDTTAGSWWDTEVDGWGGGTSASAQFVDPALRRTYTEGFRLDADMLPQEKPVTDIDAALCMITRDQCGLLKLKSWKDHYKLRKIPLTSPVALLLTFPLTVYYAIQKYGAVPVTVSKMLKRPMRLHLIGIEKELNFIDLFKEVGFLLPRDVMIEMVFIVRKDMLPPNCHDPSHGDEYTMKVELTPNLSVTIQSGTYAETIDPAFDCGSGPPDMIIAMNAGLFAYESWRSLIEYLGVNTGVVGVFTDYNEHSAVNCASLGGGDARDSLRVNPFRQPRAMPVYSMNLPQFSNGFMYAYNEQELDM